jgi:hypothetical protein
LGEGTGDGTGSEDEGIEGVGNVLAEDACSFANRFMRMRSASSAGLVNG